MATATQTSFVSPGYDYSADVNAIERKRKIAEALQGQSMQPIETQQPVAGQFATRISPLQGFSKLAQALASRRQEKKADEEQRTLSSKIQTDLSNALMSGNRALQGNPAKTIQPDPQENEQAADYGTPVVPPKNIPAVAPYSPEAIANASSIYMAHPATQALGSNLAQQNITTQQQLARAVGATGVDLAGGVQPISPSGVQPPQPTAGQAPTPGAPSGGPAAAPQPQPVQVAGPAQPMLQGAPAQPQAAPQGQPPANGQFDKNGVPIDLSRSLQLSDISLGKYWDYVKQLREPKLSANGQVMQYQQLPTGGWGYAPGAGAVAAARAYADVGEDAKAAKDIITVKVDGRDVQMTRAEAVRRFGEQSVPPATQPAPLPANVPESDRAAYEAVVGGKVPAAYGPTPQSQPAPRSSGFGVDKSPAEKAFATAGAESANKYRTAINEKVATGQDLMMRVDESQNLLKQFQAGGGQGVRVQLAQAAQAIGAPQGMVDGIARGDLGAAQAFQKIVVSQAMESLKQAMASQAGTGAGRITQAEFQIFQKANPNLELDPRALEKIYGFIKQTHARDYAEQQGFDKWLKEGKDPSDFQASWAREVHNRGVKDIVNSGQNNDPLGLRK